MIALENVSVGAGAFALSGITFEVPAGGYGVLMGKTGCGKTTILEALCGLRRVPAGRVLLGGRDVGGLAPGARGIGYVPQDRALFRTMTVAEHLGFALAIRGRHSEIEGRVAELSRLLGLGGILGRKPHGLSGGEAARVALGRALAAAPEILLLDEPLSALDDETKDEMVELLQSVRKRTGVTSLHVTHSREEARRLADKVFVIRAGILREASLAELQERVP
jgi:ABC-type sugar transport system ATPase subunit